MISETCIKGMSLLKLFIDLLVFGLNLRYVVFGKSYII